MMFFFGLGYYWGNADLNSLHEIQSKIKGKYKEKGDHTAFFLDCWRESLLENTSYLDFNICPMQLNHAIINFKLQEGLI